jgi:hypothetical protein
METENPALNGTILIDNYERLFNIDFKNRHIFLNSIEWW